MVLSDPPLTPAATLAVAHQYGAKGEVSSTIMGVAALDDVTGIINYSLAIAVASVLILGQGFDVYSSLLRPLIVIVGAAILGMAFGFILNFITRFIERETEGVSTSLISDTSPFFRLKGKFLLAYPDNNSC